MGRLQIQIIHSPQFYRRAQRQEEWADQQSRDCGSHEVFQAYKKTQTLSDDFNFNIGIAD